MKWNHVCYEHKQIYKQIWTLGFSVIQIIFFNEVFVSLSVSSNIFTWICFLCEMSPLLKSNLFLNAAYSGVRTSFQLEERQWEDGLYFRPQDGQRGSCQPVGQLCWSSNCPSLPSHLQGPGWVDEWATTRVLFSFKLVVINSKTCHGWG